MIDAAGQRTNQKIFLIVRGINGAKIEESWVTASNEKLKSGSGMAKGGKDSSKAILSWAP